ncbi:MAG TPA: asparagine synthase (glutamine-hydrolyzing), partial [Acidimicrobiales bacterium]|nr:asparagine synthase (glutamine-hydrolyzing) [Acidimicrobiales bacterium]
MCGIAGLWDRRRPDETLLSGRLDAMTAALAHRGPDDRGTFIDSERGVGLGHRRLAVIDCSPTGHQPMPSADGRYVVVTNSELYNYVELRQQLKRTGREFRGTSDTEVLVAGFERWGVRRTLERANGMFALAVWDNQEQCLYLARDRFGEKPLYFGWAGQCLLFGSELKALRAHHDFAPRIDRDAIALYFRHNCIPAPHSVYSGVVKVPPGCLVRIDSTCPPGTLPEPEAYWSLAEVAEAAALGRGRFDLDSALAELDSVLGQAVRIRMRSDVALGAFLSGGIDSSLVVALMQAHGRGKVRTFTIAFDDDAFDESRHAAAVAAHLGTAHTELLVTAEDALEAIPSLPRLYDE